MEWGFEHFELAYRLYCKGYKFTVNRQAINYHIPHARNENFYKQAIISNSKKMCKKHSEINERVLAGFVSGEIDIMTAEKTIFMKEKKDEKR